LKCKSAKINEKTHDELNKKKTIHQFLLIGAPNVGKSTFFNKVTTSVADVSNIDRMTVDIKAGKFRKQKNYFLVDLPGLYNLSHPIDEEIVVANAIIKQDYDGIINIIGSQSIERDLLLTIQTIETGLLNTLIINMADEINQDVIDFNKMSLLLNKVKIVLTQANKNKGIKQAKTNIIKGNNQIDPKIIDYGKDIEGLINQIIPLLPESKISQRFLAIMCLEDNRVVLE